MKALRIGFIGAGWSPDRGGVETVSHGLAGELSRRSHEVLALSLDTRGVHPEGTSSEARVDGVRVRRVAWTYGANAKLADLGRTPGLEAQVLRWARDAELDLVHIHHLTGWGLGVPQRLAELGLPVSWTLHDYWALCPRGQMWHVDGALCERAEPETCGACAARTWPQLAGAESSSSAMAARMELAKRALEACSRVYTPSEAAMQVLGRSGLSHARLEVCENGVVPPQSVKRRADDGIVKVAVLGSVQPSKGVLELASWITELEGFELHVHGPRTDYHGDRSYVEALEVLAARSPRIVLHGGYDLSALPALLSEIDLVAVPSVWSEVYGLTAREARSAGIPVFASRVGGLSAGDFVLLEAGSREAWQVALLRFARDAAWRRSLTGRVATQRSMVEMADQLERDYVDLVSGPGERLTW